MGSGGNLRARLNRPALERSFCKVPIKPIEQNERGGGGKREDGRDEREREKGERKERSDSKGRGKKEKKEKEKRKRELSPANKNLEGFSLSCFSSLNSPFVNKRIFLICWSAPTEMSRGCACV